MLRTIINDRLKLRHSKHPLLMTHVVLGYPSLKESIENVKIMADNGAALIELQIPFSDPIADGPTIMEACEHALQSGVRPTDCMKAMEKLRSQVKVPLLFMSYFNIVYNFNGGVEGFCRASSAAGCQGLIVPDIPVDNSTESFWELASEYELAPIPIASPLTPPRRLKKIAERAQDGFVYCVSTTGTTGARKSLATGLNTYLKTVRRHTKSPLALGFGISKPKHIEDIGGLADIAVVGSASIDLIKNTAKKERHTRLAKFIRSLTMG